MRLDQPARTRARLHSVLLIAALPALLFGAKNVDWKTGKVLDSATAKTYVQTGTSTTTASVNASAASASAQTTVQSITIRDTQLLVVTDDFAYMVEDTRTQSGFSTVHGAIIHAVSGRHHGCRFIVGDSVKFYQEKAFLHVIDADEKECKTEVLWQERLK